MIERTEDYRIVSRMVAFKVVISSKCFYLMEKKGKEIMGIWSFEPYKDGLRIHADMGPKCRGRRAIESAKDAFKWIWGNTPARTIYAGIPAKNKPACRVASLAGMRYAGFSETLRYFELKQGYCHGLWR